LRYEYAIKDHLGNTRLTFTGKNGNSKIDVTNTASNEVLQENHYYPYGLSLNGPWIDDVAIDNLYKYNGKELNSDFGLGWYDYGKRWYDPTVSRFWNPDPMIESFAYLTPYNYASLEPIGKIDLYGLQGGAFTDYFVGMLGSAVGAATAIVEDATGANLPKPDTHSAFGAGFQSGEAAGHVGMLITGVAEVVVGATGVVAAPETAGASLVVSNESAAVAVHGAFVVQEAWRKMTGENQNEKTGKGRGSNNREPDPAASGDHSVYDDRGNTTYQKNDQNPSGFDEVKRVDKVGSSHANKDGTDVPTPHVHTKGQKDVSAAEKGKDC
jgi:RHS repeat-associated protein